MVLFFVNSKSVKSQPDLEEKTCNLLYFTSDSNVYVNNTLYSLFDGLVKPLKNKESSFHYIENKAVCRILPIIIDNTISVDEDSMFCTIYIQLIKSEDTINVFIENIMYKFLNIRSVSYFVNIPFSKGNFRLVIEKPDDVVSYKGIYEFGKRELIDLVDITPTNWEELKIDTILIKNE